MAEGAILAALIVAQWYDTPSNFRALCAEIRAEIQNLRVDIRACSAHFRGDLAGLREDIKALTVRLARIEGLLAGYLAARGPLQRHDAPLTDPIRSASAVWKPACASRAIDRSTPAVGATVELTRAVEFTHKLQRATRDPRTHRNPLPPAPPHLQQPTTANSARLGRPAASRPQHRDPVVTLFQRINSRVGL